MTPAANVTIRRNRPTRTADYGPAPAGHPLHQVRGRGKRRGPRNWTRILRSGSTFPVDAQELEALTAWLEANPVAARDVTIRELPAPVEASPALEDQVDAPEGPTALAELHAALEAGRGPSMPELISLGRAAGLELEAAEDFRLRADLIGQIRAELAELGD